MAEKFRVKTEAGWADVTVGPYKDAADRDAQIDAKLAAQEYTRVNDDPGADKGKKPLTSAQKMVRGSLAPTAGGVIGTGAGMIAGAPFGPPGIAAGGYLGNVAGTMLGETVNQYMPGVREAVGNDSPDNAQIAVAGVMASVAPLIGPALRALPGAGAALQRQWFRAFGQNGEHLVKDVPTRDAAKTAIGSAKQGAAPLLVNTQPIADAIRSAENRNFYELIPAGFRERLRNITAAAPARGKTGQTTGATGASWMPFQAVDDLMSMAGKAAAAKEEAGGLMAWTAKTIYGGLADAIDATVQSAPAHIREPLVAATAGYKRMIGGEILSDLVEKSTSHVDSFGQSLRQVNVSGLRDRVLKNRDTLEKYFKPTEIDELYNFLGRRSGISGDTQGGLAGGYVRTAAGKVESAVKDASAALAISAFSYFTNQWGYMLATMGRQMVGRALASPTGRASLNAMLDHPTVVQSASNAALQGLRNDPLVKQATSATVNSARRLTTRGAGVVPEPE